MGLDQYAFALDKAGEREELAYWRKHNRLQGWMEELWEDKGRPNFDEIQNPMGDFNCQPVQLTISDIEQLEAHVENKALPDTQGFFFGGDSYEDYEERYKESDMGFVVDARRAIAEGKRVYYDSWW